MMESFLAYSSSMIGQFFIVFMRLLVVLSVAPPMEQNAIPRPVRVGICGLISLVMMPLVSKTLPSLGHGGMQFFIHLATSMIVGLFIGISIRCIFSIVDFFGLHVSNFSGLSAAAIMNPALGYQTNIISNFMAMVGIIVLLDSNYLWILFDGMMRSFHLSVSMDLLTSKMPLQMVRVVLESFIFGFRLATPFVIIGMVLQFGLGLLNRLVPQLQVFFLSIPVQVGITLFLLWFLGPKILNALSNIYMSQLDKLLSF